MFLPGLLDAPVAEVPTIDTTYPFISYLQGFFFNLKQRNYTDKMSVKQSHLQVRLNLCLSERIGPTSLLHCFLSSWAMSHLAVSILSYSCPREHRATFLWMGFEDWINTKEGALWVAIQLKKIHVLTLRVPWFSPHKGYWKIPKPSFRLQP